MEAKVITPFSKEVFEDLQRHVKEVRRIFDAPGAVYHDANEKEEERFNRWFWHNLPVAVALHNSPSFVALASEVFGESVKPSYAFLSMYGPEGVCPLHSDRPQCKYTIDLAVRQDEKWPIYILAPNEAEPRSFLLDEGQAVAYSGTDHPHHRVPMNKDSKATYADLLFFHFVPAGFIGKLS